MEFNEPLNLSIKKRPVAVVTPSSSNKTTTQSATTTVQINVPALSLPTSNNNVLHGRASTLSPSECSSIAPNTSDILASTVAADDRDQLFETTTLLEASVENTEISNSNKESINTIDSNCININPPVSPASTSISADASANLNLIDLLYGRAKSPLATTPMTAFSPNPSAKYQSATSNVKTLSIAEASAAFTSYLSQQQSLDVAKLHLERYLKVTNQYLQTTLDGANMTANEQINHLIRTNILTNKIAANNLISIINKLLEQNIISEYYFKHASRLLMSDYRDQTSVTEQQQQQCDVKNSDELMNNNKFRLSPSQINLSESDDKQNGDQECNTDTDDTTGNINTIEEPFDIEDKIKKETIPIHSNPFMSYLHMHLNRGFEQTVGSLSNSILDNSNLIPTAATISTSTKKHKSHQRSSDNLNNNIHNNNNNLPKSSSTSSAHQMAYDLSLNISSQRLTT